MKSRSVKELEELNSKHTKGIGLSIYYTGLDIKYQSHTKMNIST